LTSHRIRKNSQEIEKKLSKEGKREEPFRRAPEEDPSPGWTDWLPGFSDVLVENVDTLVTTLRRPAFNQSRFIFTA